MLESISVLAKSDPSTVMSAWFEGVVESPEKDTKGVGVGVTTGGVTGVGVGVGTTGAGLCEVV